MNVRQALARIAQQEDLNFLLTNRIPRQTFTRFIGWFSRIEQPWIRDLSIGVWRSFTDLDLSEARKTSFRSMHDCFTRELVPGARLFDPDPQILASPCDAIVGESGQVEGDRLYQAKGFPYTLAELFGSAEAARPYLDGTYVTLRLTSAMYHRFHAPADCTVNSVTYISGDTWNVNPIALARVEKLFCRNERAVIEARLERGGAMIALVPVAAILVASIRLRFADVHLHLRYRGPNHIPCQAALKKGEEMGWFEHGSTIIVFAPTGFTLAPGIARGQRIKAGQALLRQA